MSENQLVVIEDKKALQLFTTENGLDPVLSKIRVMVDEFKPDTSTKGGRDAIASMAYSIAKSKTYLDNVGKDLVDELKRQPKMVDAERKRIRDTLDAWKDEVRKPLTDLEDAEKAVIAKIDALLQTDEMTSEEIKSCIDQIKAIDISFAVIKPKDLENKQGGSIAILESRLARQVENEKQLAELERLRQEQLEREQRERDERIAREAAERARQEAEAEARRKQEEEQRKANEEKLAAERREMQLKLEAENAERRRLEAEQRAEQERQQAEQRAKQAAEDERRRIEREQAEAKAEAERQAANKAHRASVNREILAVLVGAGLDESQAKMVITMAAKNQCGRLVINY